jgi:hypothetical protein
MFKPEIMSDYRNDNALVVLPEMSLKADDNRSREQMKKYSSRKTVHILMVLMHTRWTFSLRVISEAVKRPKHLFNID